MSSMTLQLNKFLHPDWYRVEDDQEAEADSPRTEQLARERRRRALSLLAAAALPLAAALRQLVLSGAGLSRSLS